MLQGEIEYGVRGKGYCQAATSVWKRFRSKETCRGSMHLYSASYLTTYLWVSTSSTSLRKTATAGCSWQMTEVQYRHYQIHHTSCPLVEIHDNWYDLIWSWYAIVGGTGLVCYSGRNWCPVVRWKLLATLSSCSCYSLPTKVSFYDQLSLLLLFSVL